MKITVKVWRQKNYEDKGKLESYELADVTPDMSFLEMFDVLNQQLIEKDIDPVAFDHDCREGICGSCSMVINGRPHGPVDHIATCQLHMREFKDGDTIVVEPWRATAFPVIKDLTVDRSSFDRIIQAGGYISVNTGSPVDANAILVDKHNADDAFDAAACIGCGACVAACKNASASLFTAAKIGHLARLPQGQPERALRAQKMVAQMDSEGFGSCTFTGACQIECPKGISISNIAKMHSEYSRAKLFSQK